MMTAKIHGQAARSAKLQAMIAQTPEMIRDALLKAAVPIRDEARELAPVSVNRWVPKGRTPGSGHVGKGIKIRLMRSTARYHERVRIGTKGKLWYGIFPEMGTARAAAQPFLRPALDTKKSEALRIFSDEMWRRIK
jgi:HK97 gp10 family phage protein